MIRVFEDLFPMLNTQLRLESLSSISRSFSAKNEFCGGLSVVLLAYVRLVVDRKQAWI